MLVTSPDVEVFRAGGLTSKDGMFQSGSPTVVIYPNRFPARTSSLVGGAWVLSVVDCSYTVMDLKP